VYLLKATQTRADAISQYVGNVICEREIRALTDDTRHAYFADTSLETIRARGRQAEAELIACGVIEPRD